MFDHNILSEQSSNKAHLVKSTTEKNKSINYLRSIRNSVDFSKYLNNELEMQQSISKNQPSENKPIHMINLSG